MLDPQEVATYLTNAFNEESKKTADDLNPWYPKFSLLAEVSEGHQKATVEGMLVTVNEDILPVLDGFKQVLYTYRAQFFFSTLTNDEYIFNKTIIENVIADQQGKEIEFTNGKGILTFNSGTPGKTFSGSSYGSGVQYEFTVSVAYTEHAVSSGQKHWLLDGKEIPFLSESVTVETEGVPRKIFSEVYTKALITGKTKFFTFRIPYESETYKKIQQEIMSSAHIGVVHTLSYYDGAAFTQEEPFTAKVSIHRTASSSSTRPSGSTYEITFSDVYSSEGRDLRYYISLIDFPFDMNGDDTRYFANTKEQRKYFEDKAKASTAPFVEILAPNLDNLVITQQVYYSPAVNELTQFDYASKNYAIIKVEAATETRYFYYFIEKATIGAGGYVLCDLKLDTVQTYFFREDITFSDCLIERAHLDRFVLDENDPTKVRFVSDPASKIFNSEEGLNFPKRLVSREKLSLAFTGNDTVDQWLNENVAYWVYVFISPSNAYKVAKIRGDQYVDIEGKRGYIKYPIGMNGVTSCISYPIYKKESFNEEDPKKSNNVIIIENRFVSDPQMIDYIIPSYKGFNEFETNNKENNDDNTVVRSYYYTIKVSISPPFDAKNITENEVSVDNRNNLIIKTVGINYEDKMTLYPETIKTSTNKYYGLFFGSIIHKTSSSQYLKINITENNSISISDIIKTQPPQLKFNPKLNGQSFKELVISASSGDTFTYDIQKLVESEVGFEYSEPIVPEITKYYFRVAGGTGLYEEGTENNYTGLVGSTDNGLAFANSQYAAFIANNKNFYLQSNLKIGSSVAGGVVSGAKHAIAGDYVGAATQIGGSLFQAGLSAIDRSLTVDNMKNAPDQLKNANGNVIFNLFSMSDTGTELGLFAEIYSALEGDLRTANAYMDLYGFSFNDVANVKDFANKRIFHSYVKAQLQSINGNLNNIARDDLRQRFANGVRFWNSDTVEYKYENFELWLGENHLIEFWVGSNQYYAEPSATWEEFVESEYNKGLFSISGQTVFYSNYIVDKNLNNEQVLPTDQIIENYRYIAGMQIV